MELRFDVVIREVFMLLLLGSKKDVCTVMTTDAGLYVIHTGKYGAIAEFDTQLGGLPGAALSAMIAVDKKTYARKVEENQAKITHDNLDGHVRQRGNIFIPFTELINVELDGPRKFIPAAGPKLRIKATKKKFSLVFFRRTPEEVEPLVKLLQSHVPSQETH